MATSDSLGGHAPFPPDHWGKQQRRCTAALHFPSLANEDGSGTTSPSTSRTENGHFSFPWQPRSISPLVGGGSDSGLTRQRSISLPLPRETVVALLPPLPCRRITDTATCLDSRHPFHRVTGGINSNLMQQHLISLSLPRKKAVALLPPPPRRRSTDTATCLNSCLPSPPLPEEATAALDGCAQFAFPCRVRRQ